MTWRVLTSVLRLLVCGPAGGKDVSPTNTPARTGAVRLSTETSKDITITPKGPPAKELFGAVNAPTPLAARAIGSYARGCLAGAVSLPINGPDWQVMRLSRNRNWGHPRLLDFLERFARDARERDGWPGLLIGDMAQPRGGPMITGHESHQIGLDADIWLTPMPDRILTPQEREDLTATSMLKDPFTVDMKLWTPLQTKLIKRAASYPEVSRIFVHPAIKKVLCEQAGKDRGWLAKVRPWWGHYYHFHVRITCPPGSAGCEGQKPVSGDDGCGTELNDWFKKLRQAELRTRRNLAPRASRLLPSTTCRKNVERSSIRLGRHLQMPVELRRWPLPRLPPTSQPAHHPRTCPPRRSGLPPACRYPHANHTKVRRPGPDQFVSSMSMPSKV
jgi:penicillin-insensitive murein DD-endopeptidase